MELLTGKSTTQIDRAALLERMGGRPAGVDLGTGDGRYVLERARANLARPWIGVDACRENLRAGARRAHANALFVIANALALPPELGGVADEITINFPWGSLLRGLFDADRGLMSGLTAMALPGATVTLRLNAGAAAEQGVTLAEACVLASGTLRAVGWLPEASAELGRSELRRLPSTWARRLAFGRDPHAVLLRGRLTGNRARRMPAGIGRELMVG